MIVADTCVGIWMNNEPSRRPDKALAALSHADGGLVAPISAWEVAMLVTKGRLTLGRPAIEWVNTALAVKGVSLAPLPVEAAVRAGGLSQEGLHGDPAARLIVATALHFRVPLVTKDGAIREWGGVPTIW